jgi:1-aminocyclopropane-1-carboxylate deaminase/D-cysteine desulfhydrase-like pyridoxal-dependent ACC family enzyme
VVTPPRAPLALLPTPLMRAVRLEHAVGHGSPILIKRDDLTGFGAAGNKARALEFLVGEALHAGCDTLVTGGGPSSNFCQAAALAARSTGLACELVVYGKPASHRSPNLDIARRAGARLHALGDGDRSRVDAAVADLTVELAGMGRRPYAMPRGGSTPVGALGFALAVEELGRQLAEAQVEPELVVIAVGSGGSCAGLLAGMALRDVPWRLLGASVSRPVDEISAKVLHLAERCTTVLGGPRPVAGVLELVDARGPGFGKPSDDDRAAALLALETEGLLLDSTYTAKSFAVLLARLRSGAGGPVVFWHTGGLVPAIAEYVEVKGERHEPAIT